MKIDLSNLPALLQIVDVASAAITAVAAAVRAGKPDLEATHPDGTYVVSDQQIVRNLVTGATTGQTNADALLERLRAQAAQPGA